MALAFWLSVAFVLYVYAGYPVLLGVWAKAAIRLPGSGERRRPRDAGGSLPGVSVIIAARNEARRLPARIDNLLASDYPIDRIQIIVASDGSTDDTAVVLAPYGSRVQLLLLPPGGKASALNAAVMHATNPVLVFADARQQFAPDAIRRLVAPLADPQIGAVSGELVLDCEPADAASGPTADSVAARPSSTIADGVGAYWRYEKWLRRHEARVGSTVGVTGAIYAMRRWLWQPLPADTLLDDVLGPMRLVLRGYRVVFESGARAFDTASADASSELRRKVRTLAGNFQLLAHEPRLLVPGLNPVWLQFMSHKVGRLLVPYALIAIFASSAVLARDSALYAAAFLAQMAFYGLAAYGARLDRSTRVTPARAPEVFREAA